MKKEQNRSKTQTLYEFLWKVPALPYFLSIAGILIGTKLSIILSLFGMTALMMGSIKKIPLSWHNLLLVSSKIELLNSLGMFIFTLCATIQLAGMMLLTLYQLTAQASYLLLFLAPHLILFSMAINISVLLFLVMQGGFLLRNQLMDCIAVPNALFFIQTFGVSMAFYFALINTATSLLPFISSAVPSIIILGSIPVLIFSLSILGMAFTGMGRSLWQNLSRQMSENPIDRERARLKKQSDQAFIGIGEILENSIQEDSPFFIFEQTEISEELASRENTTIMNEEENQLAFSCNENGFFYISENRSLISKYLDSEEKDRDSVLTLSG